jgi:hypothetical protein
MMAVEMSEPIPALSVLKVEYLRARLDLPLGRTSPMAAAQLLALGFSTPTLDLLAGESAAGPESSLREMTISSATEMNFPEPVGQVGLRATAFMCCELIAEGALEPNVGARLIWRKIYWDLPEEAVSTFGIFESLGAEWEQEPRERPRIDDAIVSAAREVLAHRDS